MFYDNDDNHNYENDIYDDDDYDIMILLLISIQ